MTTTTQRAMFAAIALTTLGCGSSLQLARPHADARVSIVRRGEISGELALAPTLDAHYAAEDAMLAHCRGRVRFVSAAQAHALAIRDPSDPTKTDDPSSIDPRAERVYYVCVTREERARPR